MLCAHDTTAEEPPETVLPEWKAVSKFHGKIKEKAAVSLDGDVGWLGVSTLLYSKLWFHTKSKNVTLATGSSEMCLRMFNQLVGEHRIDLPEPTTTTTAATVQTNEQQQQEEEEENELEQEEGDDANAEDDGTAPSETDLLPTDLKAPLLTWVRQALHGVSSVMDYHTHIVGMQKEVTGCQLSEKIFQWKHPVNKITSKFFMKALGISKLEGEGIDQQMVDKLQGYISGIPIPQYTSLLLAFDQVYNEQGQHDPEKTAMYIPNDWAYLQQETYPQQFVAACSVHPYRKDALQELTRCKKRGTRIVKWLPNSMFIDPSSSLCDSFYGALKSLDMVLLCHVGSEHSVTFCGVQQDYGNPLLLRRALDMGCTVIMAHCGSEGSCLDIDKGTDTTEKVACYELTLRLLKDAKYKGRAFADISAMAAFKRVPYLAKVLDETSVHEQLVYGTDYPVPAIPLVIRTKKILAAGLLAKEHKVIVDQCFHMNPMLAVLVLFRLLKSPSGNSFPLSCFQTRPELVPTTAA
eukprot:TRINITY_DN66954_c7_g1_i1.p1 TRINITY_DN66954_c7_g1~~TRINITY_DN66954_c7_g1_i1.p1  ORF type:complete len:520 (+),score=56.22 TRINITY_DN66954_c7_g1_i1:25-1584(+)